MAGRAGGRRPRSMPGASALQRSRPAGRLAAGQGGELRGRRFRGRTVRASSDSRSSSAIPAQSWTSSSLFDRAAFFFGFALRLHRRLRLRRVLLRIRTGRRRRSGPERQRRRRSGEGEQREEGERPGSMSGACASTSCASERARLLPLGTGLLVQDALQLQQRLLHRQAAAVAAEGAAAAQDAVAGDDERDRVAAAGGAGGADRALVAGACAPSRCSCGSGRRGCGRSPAAPAAEAAR